MPPIKGRTRRCNGCLLLTAYSPSAALGIQANVMIASLSDATKLCSELSLAAAPPLPEPVVQALAETTAPGSTPQQVTSWAAP